MAGYYGKIPTHGDFVSRGLHQAFIHPWDAWLQQTIAHGRAHLGDQWLDMYLTSPLWRFALSPGVCAEHAWAGVIMPSVDRVGRYFPFTIAQALAPGDDPVRAMTGDPAWFREAGALALGVLETEFDRDTLDEAVDALAPPANGGGSGAAACGNPASLAGEPWRLALQDHDAPGPALAGLLQSLLAERLGVYSVWWSSGSQRIGPSLLVSPGLPAGERCTAMLDGRWRHWGWHDHEVLAAHPAPAAAGHSGESP